MNYPAILLSVNLAVLTVTASGAERPPRPLTLMASQQLALEQNLQLKIQRIDPEIARLTLQASRGIYDPVFYGDIRGSRLSDSGGFDPADFSRDAVYKADSATANVGVMGLTPFGTTYAFGGDYANSHGERNFTYFDSYNLNMEFTLSQPLLRDFWIDQGRMTIQVNRKQLAITQQAVRFAVMDVLNQLQQGYYELMFAREKLAVYRDLWHTREQFLEAVRRQVQGGILTAPDESLAQSQLAATAAEVEDLRQEVDLAENNLRILMGDSFTNQPSSALVPTEQLLIIAQLADFSQSCRSGLERRPDLAWLRTEAEKAEVDLKFRYNQLFPSLNLIAGWGRRGASTAQDFWSQPSASSGAAFDQLWGGDNPSDMVGLVLTVPLSRTAERANHRASKQRKEQSRLLVRQKEEMVMREVADAISSMSSSLRRVDANRDYVRNAQAVLAAEEKRLAGGKSTVLFVLQFQANLALARSDELRAKADYNRACAQLRFAEGSIIEASGLELPPRP